MPSTFYDTTLYEQGGILALAIALLVALLATGVLAQLVTVLMRRFMLHASKYTVGGTIFFNIIRAFIWIAGISFVLKFYFNVNPAVLVGALGVGGIALSLGLQNTLSNLLGGLQVSLSREIMLGDKVRIGVAEGTVKDITWRITTVVDDDGTEHFIPNSIMNTTTVTMLERGENYQAYLTSKR